MLKRLTQKPGRKWLFGLAGLLLLAGGLGAYLCWPSRPAEPPAIALEGVESEVANAITYARARVVKEPRSGAAWGLLGRTLLANEVYPEISLVCFAEAERLEPREPRWPYFGAGVLLNLGKAEEAVPKLQRAADLCKRGGDSTPTPRLLLAETLRSLGRQEDAEGQFKRVLEAEGDNLRAHFGLGLLDHDRAAWASCRAHLEKCLGTPSARKKTAALLAAVCQRQGDATAADTYTTLAARLPKDAGWPDPFLAENEHLAKRKRDQYRVVEQCEAEGRFRQAAEILAQLLTDYPDDYLPHLMMGRILPQMGEFPRAEKHLRRALELAPDKIQGHYLLSLVFLKEGEALRQARGDERKAKALFEKSEASARHVLKLNPDYGHAHFALGLALKSLGRREEALAAFRQAVHCNPEHAELHLVLGQALAEAGNVREARNSLEQGRLLAAPDDPRFRDALKRLDARGKPDP